MKKPLLFASILLLAFLIWRESTRPNEDIATSRRAQPRPAVREAPTPARPPNPPASQSATAAVSTPPKATAPDAGRVVVAQPPPLSGERPKPPPNAIPFELIDGLVIAYGDQLLGRPTHENFPATGFIEAPKVASWPGGEIPYSFDPRFRNPERVQRVLEYFNTTTPIRFVPLTNQKDSIVFAPGDVPLCLSYVGRIGGHQPVYLDDRCFEKEITHELMHVLGFVHEQSRPDRDQFVRVVWDKIQPNKQSQYEIVPDNLAKPFRGRPFDYQSVMIYDPTDFAKVRGDVTLESISGAKIEPAANGLSPEDLSRLNLLYSGGN